MKDAKKSMNHATNDILGMEYNRADTSIFTQVFENYVN